MVQVLLAHRDRSASPSPIVHRPTALGRNSEERFLRRKISFLPGLKPPASAVGFAGRRCPAPAQPCLKTKKRRRSPPADPRPKTSSSRFETLLLHPNPHQHPTQIVITNPHALLHRRLQHHVPSLFALVSQRHRQSRFPAALTKHLRYPRRTGVPRLVEPLATHHSFRPHNLLILPARAHRLSIFGIAPHIAISPAHLQIHFANAHDPRRRPSQPAFHQRRSSHR